MPPSTYHPIAELLMRHGVEPARAKTIAVNELRYWELSDVDAVFKKVKRPSPDFCPFRSATDESYLEADSSKNSEETAFSFEKWWPSLFQKQTQWISPPREMMKESVKQQAALCVNPKGEWSLRTSDYVALSHVWIEGLQRNAEHDGLEQTKVLRVFKTLERVGLSVEWLWTDVLAIPAGGNVTTNIEDEMLTIAIINMLPQIYSNATAVMILDALTLQTHIDSILDAAVAILCGKWATRVWTFQEIKLASKAYVVAKNGYFVFEDIIRTLKDLEQTDRQRFRSLYTFFAVLGKNDEVGLSLTDIAVGCASRKSGMDVDYARAFFPVLGLKWEFGMTREQGMQMIYRAQKRHATRMAAFFGAPRLSIRPAWAPSYLTGLEGVVRGALEWSARGIRGDWFVLKIYAITKTFIHTGRTVFNLDVECSKSRIVQCVLSDKESETVIGAVRTAIERGQAYILASEPYSVISTRQTAASVLIAEKANTVDPEQFEVGVHCAALIMNQQEHEDNQEVVFIRHGNPNVDGDLENVFLYWDAQNYEPTRQLEPQYDTLHALHSAVRYSNLALVRSIAENSDPSMLFDSSGWTALHMAAGMGNTEILSVLLHRASNVDVLSTGTYKVTPLAWAARNGKPQAIRMLHERGADLNVKDDSGWAPIMTASLECHAEAVKELIALGVDPDYLDGFQFQGTPLAIACTRYNGFETVKVLVEAGADVCSRSSTGQGTPLHRAAELGDNEVVIYLIERGAEVEAVENTTLFTPLRYAIKGGHIDSVRTLLDVGANRNAVFRNNWTIAHVAVACNKWEIMRMLTEQPMDVNQATEPEKWTPLHLALNTGASAPVIVKLLLNAGADPQKRDSGGHTPLDLTRGANLADLVAILNNPETQIRRRT
ncbi:ankyrin repeat-containing domain protein [Xylogone sp. PMI_703]|nr:ankyrin repeat-containing domain protein [Xylogone sp. PMI_703]